MLKRRRFTTFVLVAALLVSLGCRGPGASQPTEIPAVHTPLAMVTPVVRVDNDCFEPIEVVPGVTTIPEAEALWGQPDYGDPEDPEGGWEYTTARDRRLRWVFFREGRVSEVVTGPDNCTLGDVVGTLGPPAVVEVVDVGADTPLEPPANPQRILYYPELGLAYISWCSSYTLEGCTVYRTTDQVGERSLFAPGPAAEVLSQFHFPRRPGFFLVDWTGFDE